MSDAKVPENAKIITVLQQITHLPTEIQKLIGKLLKNDLHAIIKEEWNSLFNYLVKIEPTITKSKFEIIYIILCFASKIAISIQSGNLTALALELNSLLNWTIKVLANAEVLKGNQCIDEKDIPLLDKLINLLCEVAEKRTTFRDLTPTLEIWKHIRNLFDIYARSENGLIHYQETAHRSITFLLNEVGRNVDWIYKEEALKQPIEQIRKLLRVTNYYLKVLRGIVANNKHTRFIAVQEFFSGFKKAKFLPKHLSNTPIAEILDQFVQPEFDALFAHVYQHPDVPALLLKNMRETNTKRCVVLITTYLSTSVTRDDGNFINENAKIYLKIFEECFKDTCLMDSYYFEKIIVQFAAIALKCEPTKFKVYLNQHLFGGNFWLANASTEVLLTLQKYQFESSKENLQEEYAFWRRCNDDFPLFSNDVRQTHIIRLLKNIFQLSKAAGITSSAHQQQEARKLSHENFRFLLAIGLPEIYETKLDLQAIHLHISNEIVDLSHKLLAGRALVDDYYKMIVYVKLLATCSALTLPMKVRRSLMDVVFRILSDNTMKLQAFYLIITAILNLFAKHIDAMESDLILKFLSYAEQVDMKLAFPEILQFLNACSNCSIDKIRQKALEILNNNNQMATFNFDAVKIELENLEKLNLSYVNCEHKCNASSDFDGLPSKRQCYGK